ncbi:MAG: fibronectin type III domain-containing protein [Lachnospiraceae bacterium]|nr:fibronectin type III domain-containing protein [Lachnospiraceae bacterium]
MLKAIRKLMRKGIVGFMVVALMVAGITVESTKSVAAATPTFGYMASSCTLYGNVKDQDYRSFTVTINNWVNGYKYTISSSNKSVCSYSNLSVNSKSGVHFTLQSGDVGTSTITLTMCNGNGKVVQTKKMSVTVTTKGMSVPTSLRRVSATATSAKLNFKNSTTTYVTGYRIQVSTRSDFNTTVVNQIVGNKNTVNINVTGLKKNTTYYARVAATSTNGKKTYRSGWSNTVKFTTPNF